MTETTEGLKEGAKEGQILGIDRNEDGMKKASEETEIETTTDVTLRDATETVITLQDLAIILPVGLRRQGLSVEVLRLQDRKEVCFFYP